MTAIAVMSQPMIARSHTPHNSPPLRVHSVLMSPSADAVCLQACGDGYNPPSKVHPIG